MSISTLDKIKKAEDKKRFKMKIPEWKVTVLLKEPTIGEVMELQKKYLGIDLSMTALSGEMTKTGEEQDLEAFNWALLSLIMYGEQGERLFPTPEEAKEVLETRSSLVLTRLVEECSKLITPPDGKQVEAAVKNSERTPS